MEAARFWELVGTLGGTADDRTCDRLDTLLKESGEGLAFTDLVDDHVARLLAACPVPEYFRGSDLSEWLAAAVIAAGRSTYDAVLAAGNELNAEAFAWGEAEGLLIAGFEETEADRHSGPPPDHGEATAPIGVTLQWLSAPPPERLVVPFDSELSPYLDLFGDSPAGGRTPVHDPDWVEAQARLAADPDVLARRMALAPTALGLTVRPYAVEVAADHDVFGGARPVSESAAYDFAEGFEPGVERTVVLVLPETAFPATGSRVPAYVAAVRRLLDEAEAGPP